MAIKQVTTANTFAEWLNSTQSLIEKYNFYETTSNTLFAAANNTVNTYSNTVIVYNDTANTNTNVHVTASNVYNTWANVYTANATIQGLLVFAQDTANTTNSAYTHANSSYDKANGAYTHANSSYDKANGAYTHANSSFNKANGAYDQANSAFDRANTANATANIAFTTANTANILVQDTFIIVNSLLQYTNTANLSFITDDIVTNSDQNYLIFNANTSGFMRNVSVSSTKLYFNPNTGTLTTTNYNSLSDINYKKDIIVIDNAMNTIENLNGVEFTWIDSDRKSYGIIAQELEKIIPELVDGEIKKTVNYSGLIAFLINAIKELNKRITDLENK